MCEQRHRCGLAGATKMVRPKVVPLPLRNAPRPRLRGVSFGGSPLAIAPGRLRRTARGEWLIDWLATRFRRLRRRHEIRPGREKPQSAPTWCGFRLPCAAPHGAYWSSVDSCGRCQPLFPQAVGRNAKPGGPAPLACLACAPRARQALTRSSPGLG